MEDQKKTNKTQNNFYALDSLANRENDHWNKVVFILTIILLLLFGIYAVILFFPSKDQSYNKKVTNYTTLQLVSPKPSIDTKPTITMQEFKNSFETADTKIATTLEIPPLYDGVTWEEINYDSVPHKGFNKGSAWKTKVNTNSHKWNDYQKIESYYFNDLQNKNWTGGDGRAYIQFKDIQLTAPVASSVCSQTYASLGYKDRLIRLVKIEETIKPCYPLGYPGPTDAVVWSYKELYISDPVRIDDIIIELTKEKN